MGYLQEDREDGFSLVELLVVIVIIGILSAIAVGAFMNQRKKAEDAALKSDLSTIAKDYTAWTVDNKNEDFNEHVRTTLYVTGDEAYPLFSSSKHWNDIEEFPEFHVSSNSAVEIVVVSDPLEEGWTRKFDEGEFCLVGSSQVSNYNYLPGSGIRTNYDKYLFYDSRLGGVKEMDALVEAKQNGQMVSCEGHVGRYMTASGIS